MDGDFSEKQEITPYTDPELSIAIDSELKTHLSILAKPYGVSSNELLTRLLKLGGRVAMDQVTGKNSYIFRGPAREFSFDIFPTKYQQIDVPIPRTPPQN
jgi:hypothetical protein